ncbi:DUF262 domain-containing protein [Altererythrobacter luteolus]|uniref:DUF262 domain-containing protein n=1 Tax=Pontixanthobacter luteolus TaxID=295089 RepID=A0A6I4V599_9SPHN|nr:DUF262 domain-containing protein [Pontixanthobacter luteolus]MXP48206.1 DUF262 domain-containing protein [Pontixanthobacter luteolus]
MVHWNLSPHPISDIRDWSDAGRLELQPDFQRREVWAMTAKVMLIDSILSDIPLPKVFLSKVMRDGSTYRIVIDGQQRISTILDYLRDSFALDAPYSGPNEGKKFSQLDEETQAKILQYRIDFNEATNPTDRETRDVYMRVNKYTTPLTKQELRRADFPGDFLNFVEETSVNDFFDQAAIFTPTDRRRYGDAEYLSEIVAALIDGVQDKKATLDSFYIKYAEWDQDHKGNISDRLSLALADIGEIFSTFPEGLKKTRFRQKADFYSLVLAVDALRLREGSIQGKDLSDLSDDLGLLDAEIAPESMGAIFSEYAIKCVSQANSASSRRWRMNFLEAILAGTYLSCPPSAPAAGILKMVKQDSEAHCDMSYTSPKCPICDSKFSEADQYEDVAIGWPPSAKVFQVSNSRWVHQACADGASDWSIA